MTDTATVASASEAVFRAGGPTITCAMGMPPRAPMVLDAGAARTYRALVRLVEPAVPPLGDRFRVNARIVTWEGAGVLQVPPGAVIRSGDGSSVFAGEGGRARRRGVQVGHRSADGTEILDGLHRGARVIVYPGDRIEDGTRVVPEAPAR